MRGLRTVGDGRSGDAIGVRVKISRHLRSALSRSTMRIDQGLRIDLEVALRPRMHIRSGQSYDDPIPISKQDAATLARMGLGGVLRDVVQNPA